MTKDWGRKPITVEEGKVVNKKSPDPGGVLRGKPMLYDWNPKKLGESSQA